jgi:hypothetical protein
MSKKILLASVFSTVALGAMSQDASSSSIRELVVEGVPVMARTVSVASPMARTMVRPTYKMSYPSRMMTTMLRRNFSTEANKTNAEVVRILTNVEALTSDAESAKSGPSNEQLKRIADELTLLRTFQENDKKISDRNGTVLLSTCFATFVAINLIIYDGLRNDGKNIARFEDWVSKKM